MWFSSGVHKQKVYYECLQLHPLAAAVELDLQVCSLSGAQLTSTPALHLAPILGYTAIKAAFLHKNTIWNVFRKSLKLEKRAETIRKISNNNKSHQIYRLAAASQDSLPYAALEETFNQQKHK